MSILNMIFDKHECARLHMGACATTHKCSHTHVHKHILKRPYTNGIDYSEKGYTLTIWQTKVWFLADKILIFN